jgi:hypothetical protein
MSAINRPNIHINNTSGNLQESYIIKKMRTARDKPLSLADRLHPDNEEYVVEHDKEKHC